jgi:hypothetical protein
VDPSSSQAMAHLTHHLNHHPRPANPADLQVVTKTLEHWRTQGCRYRGQASMTTTVTKGARR